jgi:predicted transcriptional regulator
MKTLKRDPPSGSNRAPRRGTVRLGLGPRESKVLGLLWGHDREVTVRDVHAAFPELAYTTRMTTLNRLYRKGS